MDNLETKSVDKSMEQSQLKIDIHEALMKLSFEHREVIVLRDIEGFSYDEISNIIDKPVGTVKSRIFTARNMLKDELEK